MNVAGYGLPISQLDPIQQGIFSGGKAHAPYLGPLPQLANVDPYEGTNHQFFSFPESKKGQSQHLGDTVLDVLFTVDKTYISRDILPLYPTDQVTFSWTQFILNAHMLEFNPYGTRAHAVTQKRNIRRAQLVRRGIEAEFEGDFLKSDLGRASFLGALRQISNALKATIHYDGIRAIMNCHRQQNHIISKTTTPSEKDFLNYLDSDVNRFGIVQKEKNGLVKLHAEIGSEMQSRGGEADAYLIPENVAIYQGLVREENTDHYLAGDMGPARINGTGPYMGTAAANTQGVLRRVEPSVMLVDASVYIVKDNVLQGLNASDTQAMSRCRQIGEYYKMIDDCQNYDEYRTKHRSIRIYSEDEDDMVEITLEDLIKYGGDWDANGNVNPIEYTSFDDQLTRNDQDEDFMTMISAGTSGNKGGKYGRRPIRFIGDIDPAHMETKCALNAGRAILNLVKRQYGLSVTEMFQKSGSPSVYNITTETKTLINETMKILGIDNAPDNKYKTYDDAAKLSGLKPIAVTTTDSADKTPATGVEGVKSKLEPLFFKTLIAGAPAGKRTEINAVISNDSMSRLQKADAIKSKIISYVQENVQGCIFKSENDVKEWHAEKLQEYDTLVRQEQAKIAAPVSSKSGEKQIYGYVYAGTDLSGTNFQYIETEPQEQQSNREFESLGMLADPLYGKRRTTADGRANFDAVRTATFEQHVNNIKSMSDSAVIKVLAIMWLAVPFNKNTLLLLATNDIPVPFGGLLFRQHMQYMTQAIAKVKKGGTGITPIGTTDMRLGHTVGTKMATMHFTTHTRSIITQPQNVYIQADVHVQEYLGGAGARFWDPVSYKAKDFKNLKNSLIAVLVPPIEKKFPKRMSVVGRFFKNAGGNQEQLQYSTAPRYVARYNLGSTMHGSEYPLFSMNPVHNNQICSAGHQENFNPKSGTHSIIHVNKGHFGPDVYAGIRIILLFFFLF
jgi:hypothetical protein